MYTTQFRAALMTQMEFSCFLSDWSVLDVVQEYLRGQCRYCKHNLVCTSRKGPHSNCWEWRGQKKD